MHDLPKDGASWQYELIQHQAHEHVLDKYWSYTLKVSKRESHFQSVDNDDGQYFSTSQSRGAAIFATPE